mgnify:CR=1 FL=1
MDKLKLEHHLTHLEDKHLQLEKKINEGYSHYLSDSGLMKMKQEKLNIKRQIEETKEKIRKNRKTVAFHPQLVDWRFLGHNKP